MRQRLDRGTTRRQAEGEPVTIERALVIAILVILVVFLAITLL